MRDEKNAPHIHVPTNESGVPMEAPVGVIIFGGMIAELLIAGAFFAAIGILAVAIALIAVSVVYVKRVREAIRTGPASWVVNLIASPLLGTLAGILFVHYAVYPSTVTLTMTSPHEVLGVFVTLSAIYGFFFAPFTAPILLMKRPGTRAAGLCWALSYYSFACLTYAWIAMYYADVTHVIGTCPHGMICFT